MFDTGSDNHTARRLLRTAMAVNPARNRRPGTASSFSPLFLLAVALVSLAVLVHAPQSVSAQTSVELVEVPGPVAALSLSADTNSVTVEWRAPESGGDPGRYIVHVRPKGGDSGSGKTKTPKASKTSVTFDNLEPGATYKVWVRAKNEAGKGERVHAEITLPEDDSPPQSAEQPVGVIHCRDYYSDAYCGSFR